MSFTIEVKGLDRLKAKMEEMAARLPEAAQEGCKKAADDTLPIAVRLAHGNLLKSCIKAEIVTSPTGKFVDYGGDGKVVAARVFNDTSELPWSSYVEFGTGFYVDNEGIPEAIILKRAKRIPWYIHVDMVPASFARFGYPRVGDYWEVDGMKPRPYMKPAGFQRREDNRREVVDSIYDMIREVCG